MFRTQKAQKSVIAIDAMKMIVANSLVGSNMDLSWRNGPIRKSVLESDMMFPIVYRVANATMLTNISIEAYKYEMERVSFNIKQLK